MKFDLEKHEALHAEFLRLRRNKLEEKLSRPTDPEREEIRSLPCTILPDDKLWCLSGETLDENGRPNGGGILEWCYSREDAMNEMARLWYRKDLRKLRVHKYQP